MKIITYIFTAILLIIFTTNSVKAHEFMAEESGKLKAHSEETQFDYRVSNLKNFLERYGSPLSVYADKYGVDYRLVPAISGVESTFGKHIPNNSYNAYGWANGEYRFTSWDNSIDHVSMTLKTKYIDSGAPSITQIARRYAPPSLTWTDDVKYFIEKNRHVSTNL